MTDKCSKRSIREADSHDEEIRYFAEKYGIRLDHACELINECGNDSGRLDREVRRFKGVA